MFISISRISNKWGGKLSTQLLKTRQKTRAKVRLGALMSALRLLIPHRAKTGQIVQLSHLFIVGTMGEINLFKHNT